MTWLALLIPMLLQEEPDIEKLQTENKDLKEQVTLLEKHVALLDKSALDDAYTIQRLKQVIKALRARPVEPAVINPISPDEQVIGPETAFKTKILHIDSKMDFIMVEGGLKEGIKLGWRFEINRLGPVAAPGDPRLPQKIAVAEFDKYMGQEKRLTLLRVIEGNTKDILRTDEAVAIRRLAVIKFPTPGTEEKPERGRPENIYQITGRTGTADNAGHIVNYGSNEGARQSHVLWVYKNNEYKARLRLDQVEKLFSVGFVIDGSQVAPPTEEDDIYTREPRKIVFGKVAMVDRIKGIAVDVNKRTGARAGQRFQVRRKGKIVGTIVLINVQTWGSWARVESGTRIMDIQKGDVVELID